MEKMMRALFLIMSVFFLAQPLFAAARSEPAYRVLEFHAAYPWSAGLAINLRPDEKLCRKKYGRQWSVKCAASFGRYGDTARGVKMTPQAGGHWQWAGPASLVFVPDGKDSLKPDTVYKVDLSGLYFPASVILDRKTASCRTDPPGARLLSSSFWLDPSQRAEHRLTASFEFNFPAPESAGIEILAPAGCQLGKAELLWNQNRDGLNISCPVKKLPEQAGQARILLRGMGQVVMDGGRRIYMPASGNGVTFSQNIPGADNIFRIKKLELRRELDKNLDEIQTLHLETSLYTTLDELLRHLEIWQLPKYAFPGATVPYDWLAAPAVPSSALAQSRKLEPAPLTADHEPRSGFRIGVPAQGGSYVFVSVGSGLRSASGQKMGVPWAGVVRAEHGSGRLGFMQPGNVLSIKENGVVDIFASGLDKIVWKARRVRDPFLALLAQGSDNVFERPLENANIAFGSLGVSASGAISLPQEAEGKAQFTTLDLAAIFRELAASDEGGAAGIGLVTLIGLKNGENMASASRLVLATDLGLLVKAGALDGLDCFVSRLSASKPALGAQVSILGANGKPLATAVTDERGHAAFPSLAGLDRENLPVAAVAELDGNLAWLPLRDASRQLNYSEFDTGGAHARAGGLSAFAFSQRGIYRPGDTLHFGCVLRRADFALLPEDLPLVAQLRDPRGKKVWQRTFKSGKYGIADLEWLSPRDALSGLYNLDIRTADNGEILTSASARLEEFQPDTLKMKLVPPVARGWLPVGSSGPEIGLELGNLYGSPARGHKIRSRVDIVPASFRFAGFEDYTFMDAAPFSGQGSGRNLPETVTDEQGRAILRLPAGFPGQASALVTVSAEGLEMAGGRAVAAQTSFLASPLPHMLGYRASPVNLDFIGKGQKAEVEFLALDSQLRPEAWNNLDFSLCGRRYVTSLVSDGRGGFRYDETPVNSPVKSWKQDIGKGGRKIALDTARPGEFVLRAMDGQGRLLAEVPYSVVGEELLPPDSPLAPARMRMRLDKKDYSAGDEISIALSLPYAGYGLISIEREGVAAFEWFSSGGAGDITRRIAIPDNFEGRGYVAVSYVRSGKWTSGRMEPHAFAVAPFSANMRRRDMELRLDAPRNVRPGGEARVRLSAREQGLAMVFAVDEGVLRLTGYQTPKPLDALLADRALDVRTLQAFNLLMPASARFSAFGGGMEGASLGSRFHNPFKRRNEPPVAVWSALAPVGPQDREIVIPIPDYYNGELRVMAVGAAGGSAGSASVSVTAAAPLVLSPRLPLAVTPGDVFEGCLIIANNADSPKNVNLAVQVNGGLELAQPMPDSASIAPGAEMAISLRLRALDTPGQAEAVFTAIDGQSRYKRSGYLSIRPASPLRTSLMAGIADASAMLSVRREVYERDARSVASLSALPIPLAGNFSRYLETYPYGCTEQLVSRAFGHALLAAWPGITADSQARQKLLDATLGALRARFNGGGVSLWPDSEPSFALGAYAADFLLTMRESGSGAGRDMLDRLCDSIAADCVLNEPTLEAARNCAYAIWVLTREGRVTTQLLESLLDNLRARGPEGWREDVTCVLLAASQKQMHMSNILPFENIAYRPDGGWFDEYAQHALHVALVARHFPELCSERMRRDFFDATAEAMMNNRYATFSASQGIRALLALAGNSAPRLLQAGISCADANASGETSLLADGAVQTYETARCASYALQMPQNSQPLFWQVATSGYDRKAPDKEVANGIEIAAEYLDRDGRPVKTARQGDELTVRVTARAMTAEIRDCVITCPLPGGFEMVLRRDGDDSWPRGAHFRHREEDRMLIFTDLTNQPAIFSWRIRAVNGGVFSVPPVSAQAMYNQAQYGHGAGGSIEITE